MVRALVRGEYYYRSISPHCSARPYSAVHATSIRSSTFNFARPAFVLTNLFRAPTFICRHWKSAPTIRLCSSTLRTYLLVSTSFLCFSVISTKRFDPPQQAPEFSSIRFSSSPPVRAQPQPSSTLERRPQSQAIACGSFAHRHPTPSSHCTCLLAQAWYNSFPLLTQALNLIRFDTRGRDRKVIRASTLGATTPNVCPTGQDVEPSRAGLR